MKSAPAKYAILFFACVLFHILGTWSLPLIDRDEPRFAEASREMIERGNYIVPYFNNQLRLDKPPLTYWAQVASYHMFGENDFAARFPSAIAAALTAILIFAWGRRMGGEKLGWWAAIIFTLSLQTFAHAKAAVADMWLVLFVTLASWAGYELLADSNRAATGPAVAPYRQTWWWLMFYLSLALGFLAKGPIAWTPLITVAVVIIYTRKSQFLGCFEACARNSTDALRGRALGNPGADSNTWRVFQTGNRTTRRRPFVYDTGRSWREFPRHVRAVVAVLFCYDLHQFLSVVDQVAVVDSEIVAEQKRQGSTPPATAEIRSILICSRALRSSSSSSLWSVRNYRTIRCRPFRCFRFCLHGIGTKDPRLKAAASCLETLRSQLHVCGSQLPSWYRKSWRGFSPRISSFKCLASLYSRTCNLLRSSSRSRVWSGIFARRVRSFLTPLKKRRAAEFMKLTDPRFIILPTTVAGELFANPPANWRFFTVNGFNIAKGKQVDLTLVLKSE